MNKKTVDSIGSTLMSEMNERRRIREQEYLERINNLHADIKANPSAKFRDCEEDNQHPYWEPEFPYKGTK